MINRKSVVTAVFESVLFSKIPEVRYGRVYPSFLQRGKETRESDKNHYNILLQEDRTAVVAASLFLSDLFVSSFLVRTLVKEMRRG